MNENYIAVKRTLNSRTIYEVLPSGFNGPDANNSVPLDLVKDLEKITFCNLSDAFCEEYNIYKCYGELTEYPFLFDVELFPQSTTLLSSFHVDNFLTKNKDYTCLTLEELLVFIKMNIETFGSPLWGLLEDYSNKRIANLLSDFLIPFFKNNNLPLYCLFATHESLQSFLAAIK